MTVRGRQNIEKSTRGSLSMNLVGSANVLKRKRDIEGDVDPSVLPPDGQFGKANKANKENDAHGTRQKRRCLVISQTTPKATTARSILKSSRSTPQRRRQLQTWSQRRQHGSPGESAEPANTHSNTNSVICVAEEEETEEDSDNSLLSGSELYGSDEDSCTRADMSGSKKPGLKLRLSTSGPAAPFSNEAPAQSPAPQSAVRTPSIKLNFKPKTASPGTPQIVKIKKGGAASEKGSAQKRKRQPGDDGAGGPAAKEPKRRLTLKTPITPAPTAFKLKTKGKIPKRLPGSGYDSELEEREVDPVILEGFILRMPPGPDCEYVRNAITNGTVGIHRTSGGADIRMRFLDQAGRRGIIIVNGTQYATTVVDLPCVIEGMKSWDKKGWIKSMDVSQMMLVLGPCESDDEAKDYPLPSDVDPKTYTYEHGITAPMKWVRKRRFARTRRARVDDIESIERKVQQLLEADKKAISVQFSVSDHDPRLERDQYSEGDSEDDAEAEDDDGDYFAPRNGYSSAIVETPGFLEGSPMREEPEIGQEEVDEFERLLMEGDVAESAPTLTTATTNGHAASQKPLTIPSAVIHDGASVAVSSASPSPAPFSGAPTPAADAADGHHHAQSSEDEESDADDDDDSGADDNDKDEDADDNLQQVKDRITDMEAKIREQTAQLRSQKNAILRKKLATKIQALKDDVDMMKKQHGLGDGDDDGDGGDD